MLPSNHVPSDAVEHPEAYGGINCLVSVPLETVDELRAFLTEEVGPQEQYSRFFSSDFDTLAKEVYVSLGSPQISLSNIWDLFVRMDVLMDTSYN